MKPPAMLNAQKNDPRGGWSAVILALLILLTAFLAANVWISSQYIVVEVKGSSMYDTLYGGEWDSLLDDYSGGDILYAERKAEYSRGDIVIIDVSDYEDFGLQGEHIIIKRIIAVGGDRIKCENGIVYLAKEGGSYEKLDEPYLNGTNEIEFEYTLEDGEIFVMGDNRTISLDSRKAGPLKEEEILGTVPEWSVKNKNLISAWENFRASISAWVNRYLGWLV